MLTLRTVLVSLASLRGRLSIKLNTEVSAEIRANPARALIKIGKNLPPEVLQYCEART